MGKKINKDKLFEILPAVLLLLSFSLMCLRGTISWAEFSAVIVVLTFFFSGKIKYKNNAWNFFLLAAFVSCLFSVFPAMSLWDFWKQAVFILFFALAASNYTSSRALSFWHGGILLCALFSLALVFWEGAFLKKFFSNPNYAAVFLNCAAVLSVFKFFSSNNKRSAATFIFLSILFVWGMLKINSRGALFSFSLCFVFIIVYFRRWKAGVYATIFVLLLVLSMPDDFIEKVLKLNSPTSYKRIDIWWVSLKAFAERPLFGWGPGFFREAFSSFKFPFFYGISYYGHNALNAHSQVLNFMVEGGLALGGAFIFALAKSFDFRRDGKIAALPSFIALACFLQGLVDIVFFSGAVALLFWGSLGFLADFSKAKAVGRRFAIIAAGMFLISFCFHVYFAGLRKNALENGDLNALEKVLSYNKIDERALTEFMARDFLKNKNYARFAAISDLGRTIYPYSPYFRLAAAEGVFKAGSFREAEIMLREALSLEPNFCRARLMLAEILVKTGKKGKALQEIAKIKNVLRRSREVNNKYDAFILSVNERKMKEIEKRVKAGL